MFVTHVGTNFYDVFKMFVMTQIFNNLIYLPPKTNSLLWWVDTLIKPYVFEKIRVDKRQFLDKLT